ncbi:MAG: class II glutamine amidotransferase [Bacteroidetes bacterium]|nr:class II glutamine amidotransferase [Bacteroidota bacterium]
MSDTIHHHCGIAFIRLRYPLSYYLEKYGTALYGINKLYLLMEKQHNRGQDGAGVASIKLDVQPGYRYFEKLRSVDRQPIEDIFQKISKKYKALLKENPGKTNDAAWIKEHFDFAGEVLMGHLRYATHGEYGLQNCHPVVRQNNWRSRTLALAGNFNMTNVDELFDVLVNIGQHPKDKIDTVIVLEKIGHFLDEGVQAIYDKYKSKYPNSEITEFVENELDLIQVLKNSFKDFDGGYAMTGITGNGSAFVARDPAGIRPVCYYADDEVVVAASEKPAIKTAFEIEYNEIKEIPPGYALIVNTKGDLDCRKFIEPLQKKSCSFERIYFSRSSDPDIYKERKMLGRLLAPKILKTIDYDLENTIFSYIPNTAETALLGLMEAVDDLKSESQKPRIEKLVIKDAKLRTFITNEGHRGDLVAHIYDATYEIINKGKDTLVVIDDSIVRGTTLEKSILRMLDKLGPKRIVIVSSAPQIRYPDCYGIDMSKMKDFVAFRAVIKLLEDSNKEYILEEVYEKCKVAKEKMQRGKFKIRNPKSEKNPKSQIINHVKEIYAPFSDEEISNKIAQIIVAPDSKTEVKVLYQTVENLHKACPDHLGDWYFTGNYPTPGGNIVANQAFINYMEGSLERAY